MNRSANRHPRWWPAWVILALTLGALLWVWNGAALHRQSRVMSSFAISTISALALGLWLTAFSRLRPGVRVGGLALGILLALVSASSVRVRGVSGDLVPVLEWRWASRAAPARPAVGARDDGLAEDSRAAAASVVGSVPAGAVEASFPRILGPAGDGVVGGVPLDPDWENRPPRELWRRPVGQGWSGFVIEAGLAVTQEQLDGRECVSALDARDGTPRWSHCGESRFEDPLGGPGPRATPMLSSGAVYALGARGRLSALDLQTGRLLWERDVLGDHGAGVPEYGVAASPLVLGDAVMVAVGGTENAVAAYDRRTGEPRWASGSAAAAYSSPQLMELAGRPQLVVLMEQRVLALDASSGEPLWRHNWPFSTQFVAQPLRISAGQLLVSAGYGAGSRLLEVVATADGGLTAGLVWESPALKSKMSNFVHRDGFVYGLDDGRLACLDPGDGTRVWKGKRYGHGQMLLVDGFLLIQAENGDVALAVAEPDGFREVASITALDGKTWNHPALAGSLLLVRNDREAVALELPVR